MGRTLLPAFVLLAVLLLAGGALAETENDTKTLFFLDHVDIEMDNSEAYSMRVTIDVRVSITHGGSINARG